MVPKFDIVGEYSSCSSCDIWEKENPFNPVKSISGSSSLKYSKEYLLKQ